MRVFVYWNLHRKVWSVKALEGPEKGRVIAHSPHVMVMDAAGKVSQAGRQRVIREKRKNVHAGIVGTLAGLNHQPHFTGEAVTYNPYKYETFVYRDTEAPFEGAEFAYLSEGKVKVS